ncbi:hypothetical protein B0H34DRAFT_677888 [Crassisporium funariophilum]|nr:hypothetical protein B0H34DRAFT_677888 [Crassisporium funariophilum]
MALDEAEVRHCASKQPIIYKLKAMKLNLAQTFSLPWQEIRRQGHHKYSSEALTQLGFVIHTRKQKPGSLRWWQHMHFSVRRNAQGETEELTYIGFHMRDVSGTHNRNGKLEKSNFRNLYKIRSYRRDKVPQVATPQGRIGHWSKPDRGSTKAVVVLGFHDLPLLGIKQLSPTSKPNVSGASGEFHFHFTA